MFSKVRWKNYWSKRQKAVFFVGMDRMKKRSDNKTMDFIKALFVVGAELTSLDIAFRLRITRKNARPYINILHQERFIHIKSYTKGNVPVYSVGDFPDADKPTKSNRNSARMKLYRKKIKEKEFFISCQTKSIVALTLGI